MTKGYHIFMGWGLALTMTFGAAIGLPKLAEASAMRKDYARWDVRAQDFAASDQNTGAAHYNSAASFARAAAGNVWMRDYKAQDGTLNGLALIGAAKNNARHAQCLAEAVYYEARSETRAGQKAVAEVVLNRVSSKHFPNTICGVVYQGAQRTSGCQFSFACDGATEKLPSGKHWDRSQEIAEHMIMGLSAPVTNRATHYHTTGVNPKWAALLRQTRQYDTHVFYRFMPRKSTLRPVSVAP